MSDTRPRSVPEYRTTRARRFENLLMSGLVRVGVVPSTYILTTTGRRTGRRRRTPVTVVRHDGRLWLVAPYGPVSWVHNARAAGHVSLSRRWTTTEHAVREAGPAEAGPVLRRYVRIARVTRPSSWPLPTPRSPTSSPRRRPTRSSSSAASTDSGPDAGCPALGSATKPTSRAPPSRARRVRPRAVGVGGNVAEGLGAGRLRRRPRVRARSQAVPGSSRPLISSARSRTQTVSRSVPAQDRIPSPA
jgi:deazaflavin-dependent oxidoreductase (nitroreductase family)